MIGITHGSLFLGSGPNKLKRDSLFFDKLSIVCGDSTINAWRHGPYSYKSKYQNWANEVEYLIESGHFLTSDKYKRISQSEITDNNRSYYEMCTQLDDISAEMDNTGRSPTSKSLNTLSKGEFSKINYLNSLQIILQARMAAEECKIFHNKDASSIVSSLPEINVKAQSITQGDVLSLCINQVPLPSEDTPWEQIFEMKADNDLLQRARKLRLWTRDIASQGLSVNQAEEYLEYLLVEYEKNMMLHTKKYQRGVIETALVGTADMVEDLLKFRFGKLAKKAFDVKNKKNDLLIAEMQAPGREVSLITKINDVF
jgi:hypothetical protein